MATRHRAGAVRIFALTLVALAWGCVGAPSNLGGPADPAAGPFLEAQDPHTLAWVAPLAAGIVDTGEPVDLVVATQHPEAVVVHFAVDGREVGVCDASATDDDCHDEHGWSFTTQFDAAGHHAVRAWFVTTAGATIDATQDLDVVSDAQDATVPPSASADEPDPNAGDQLVTEGSGQIVEDDVGPRGYLYPSRPFHNACGGIPWETRGGRMLLQHGRIDGSTARVERCWQQYRASFQPYGDLDYVSRASLVAAAIAAGNCDCDTNSWRRGLVRNSTCASLMHRDATACGRAMASNPDFALDVAARYLALRGSRRRHQNDPPRIAALLGSRAVNCSRANAWHLRAPAGYINRFVGAYNAYRTAEHMGLLDAPPRSPWPAGSGVSAVWPTTQDGANQLARQADVPVGTDVGTAATAITVDDTQQFQSMEGSGGALTDTSAWLLYHQLSSPERDRVLERLFDPVRGIGMSFLRLPIGAADFVHTVPADHTTDTTVDGVLYAYDDRPSGSTDPLLSHLAITHDEPYIIHALQQARRLDPALRIVASPWSPPRWMKTNDRWDNPTHRSYLCGSPSAPPGSCSFDARGPWADYLTRFLEAYEQHGVPIDAITPQNEPGQNTGGYPGLELRPADEADFVGNYLGPAIDRETIAGRLHRVPRVLAWDWNASVASPTEILSHAAARSYVSGLALHCYGGLDTTVAAADSLHAANPCDDIFMTECATPPGSGPSRVMDLVINMSRHWARSVLVWNLALDNTTDLGPGVRSGCFHPARCDGTVFVDAASHKARWGSQYYELGHASMFVHRGARRIASGPETGPVSNVAFRNPDGSIVLLVIKSTRSAQPVQVQWDRSSSFGYTLARGRHRDVRLAGRVARAPRARGACKAGTQAVPAGGPAPTEDATDAHDP